MDKKIKLTSDAKGIIVSINNPMIKENNPMIKENNPMIKEEDFDKDYFRSGSPLYKVFKPSLKKLNILDK
jgi:hypothetical protein